MTHPLAPLALSPADRQVGYVLIGVSRANLFGPGRDKDKFFLATHKDALEQLLKRPESL